MARFRVATAVLSVLAVLSLPSLALAQVNIAGDWELTVNLPQGANMLKATFTQDGAALMGKVTTQLGEAPLKGTVADDVAKFTWSIAMQGTNLDIAMTAKVDGSSMTGTATLGALGEGSFTGKRASAADASAAPAPARAASVPAVASSAAGAASGDWDVSLTTPQGPMTFNLTLLQDGEKLSGMFHTPMGEMPLTGTMTGKMLKMAFNVTVPQGEFKGTLSGELDGDVIDKGSAEFGPMGTIQWNAKRAAKK